MVGPTTEKAQRCVFEMHAEETISSPQDVYLEDAVSFATFVDLKVIDV